MAKVVPVEVDLNNKEDSVVEAIAHVAHAATVIRKERSTVLDLQKVR